MIKLSYMRAFFDSVDEQWCSPLLDRVAAAWPHEPGSAFILRASANFIAVYQAGDARRILRFTPVAQRSQAEIEDELAFLRHLAARGAPVAGPVPSREGRWIERCETPFGGVWATAFARLPGEHREIDALDEGGFAAWGRALGALHNAAQGFSGAGRPGWQEHLAWVATALPVEEGAMRREAAALRNALARLPVTPENFGLIHYDFELDNILWQDGQPGIIDFDDCARYWLAADVAYALRDLWDDRADRVDLGDARLGAFVSGYRTARALPEEELARLPLVMRLLNLHKLRQLNAIVGEPPTPDEPRWLADLREKLRAKAAVYREVLAGG